MRVISLAFLLIAACASAGEHDDSALTAPDAGVKADDPTPTPVDPNCYASLTDPAGTYRGRVGGTGGGKGPLLACDDVNNERIVGMAIRMSNQNTILGSRSAHGLGIACARVTIKPDGTPEVGTVKMIEVSGSGTNMWSPSTWGPVTSCKPGWIMSGLKVSTGTNRNLFIDATMICSKLGADGKATTTERIKIANSLTLTTNPDEVSCAAGQVVAQLGTWTGSGLDAVDLLCSAPKCR